MVYEYAQKGLVWEEIGLLNDKAPPRLWHSNGVGEAEGCGMPKYRKESDRDIKTERCYRCRSGSHPLLSSELGHIRVGSQFPPENLLRYMEVPPYIIEEL